MMSAFFDIVMHLDQHMLAFLQAYGFWMYILLAAIIFSETGLVVFVFLPGDSLLFVAGSIAGSIDNGFDIRVLFVVLCLAAILGNKVNYLIGRYVGEWLLGLKRVKLISRVQFNRARLFYEKHGGKTIIFARFMPVIRTLAPFVAGMSGMNMRAFAFYNLISGVLWVGSLLAAGYWFGSLPFVKDHFSMIIYAIIGVSLLPVLISAMSRK